MESVALIYAKALFSLSLEEKQDKEILEELTSIYNIVKEDDSLIKLLDSRVISKDEKKDILTSIFNGKVAINLLNFLKLLVDKSRIFALKDICIEYKKVYYEHYKIKEAKVYSATPLSDQKIIELKAGLEKKYDRAFVLETYINEELVAGIKVIIGDLVIDGSIDNKLARLKKDIMFK